MSDNKPKIGNILSDLTPKKPVVVVVDIDGVLFDTPRQAVTRWNSLFGTEHDITDIYDHDAIHDKTKFRHYHENGRYDEFNGMGRFDDGFYDGQKDVAGYIEITGAKEALRSLHNRGVRVVALTSRDPRKLRDETLGAINDHFGIGQDVGGLIDEVLFAGDPDIADGHRKKSEIMKSIGGDVLVDDAVRYVKDVGDSGLSAILLRRSYNESGHDWPLDRTANSWKEVLSLIEQEFGTRITTITKEP